MGTNLADPSREPTDEELGELFREAFANVAKANEASLAALRAKIAAQRAKVLEELDARLASAGRTP